MPVSFSFSYPEALWLLLLLPLVFLMSRRVAGGRMLRKRTRRISVIIRSFIIILLVLALAGLQAVRPSQRQSSVFLVDVSDSMGQGGRDQSWQFVTRAMQSMQDEQQAGVIVFGQEAHVHKLVNPEKTPGELVYLPPGGYTNLSDAVRLGTALLTGDAQGRLVLLSDGHQNLDDVRQAAQLAASAGIPVDVLPVKRLDAPDAQVANIQMPANLRLGEEFALKALVNSSFAGPARLQILQDNEVIVDKPVDLVAGQNLFSEQLTARKKGPASYRAQIIAEGDSQPENNLSEAAAFIKSQPRALLVEGHPDQKEAANLEAALNRSDVETTVIPPDHFPAQAELVNFDAVVLVNVPASALKPENMKQLQSLVKDQGKGLVVVGGEESYGLGGYFRTPLEEMLPVELQLPSKLKTPSVAMVLVIDRSGSMGELYRNPNGRSSNRSKMEMAKDAAYLAVQQLSSTDQVGVVTFDTYARWQVPLGPLGDPTSLSGPIGRIFIGGGTNIYSGFQPAVEALEKVTATNKHIIILTDGQDTVSRSYDGLVEQAGRAGITVSTVGLGSDVNTSLLNTIAEKGGGRYTFVNDSENLPKIFAKEARLAARSYIVEEPFTPASQDSSSIIKGITTVPELKGYVATRARDKATIALVTGRQEPLLAHWQYGLGRVAAWTSDAKGRWATGWLGWSDFPRFWSQVVRWSVSENAASGLQVQTKLSGNRIVVTADAIGFDSRYLNGLQIKAKVNAPGGVEQPDITLVQTAPGHYEGYFEPKNAGSYSVSVQGQSLEVQTPNPALNNGSESLSLLQTVTAVAPYSPEFRQSGTNDPLLKEIAAMTGGRLLAADNPQFTPGRKPATRLYDLWPWLMLLALLLFPLDIAVRTIRLSPLALYKGWQNHRKMKQVEAAQAAQAATQAGPVEVMPGPAATPYSLNFSNQPEGEFTPVAVYPAEYGGTGSPPVSYHAPDAEPPQPAASSPDTLFQAQAILTGQEQAETGGEDKVEEKGGRPGE